MALPHGQSTTPPPWCLRRPGAPATGAALRKGIAQLYDESSALWERQWGEHMHTGHYGSDGTEEKDHIQVREREIVREGAWGYV